METLSTDAQRANIKPADVDTFNKPMKANIGLTRKNHELKFFFFSYPDNAASGSDTATSTTVTL